MLQCPASSTPSSACNYSATEALIPAVVEGRGQSPLGETASPDILILRLSPFEMSRDRPRISSFSPNAGGPCPKPSSTSVSFPTAGIAPSSPPENCLSSTDSNPAGARRFRPHPRLERLLAGARQPELPLLELRPAETRLRAQRRAAAAARRSPSSFWAGPTPRPREPSSSARRRGRSERLPRRRHLFRRRRKRARTRIGELAVALTKSPRVAGRAPGAPRRSKVFGARSRERRASRKTLRPYPPQLLATQCSIRRRRHGQAPD